MKSYDEFSEWMAGRDRRKADRNTEIIRRDADTFSVLYYGSEVVRVHRLGLWRLDACGWHTRSTALRMVRYSPMSVCGCSGRLYIRADGGLVCLLGALVVDGGGRLSESGAVLMR